MDGQEQVEMIVVERNGFKLTGPSKPKRNDYIRVSVEVVTDKFSDAHTAWSEAVSLAYSVYGAVATEDGNVGQFCQVEGASGQYRNLPVKGRRFSLGLNLYGKRQKDVLARIAQATGKAVSYECDTCGVKVDEDTKRCIYGTCDGRMKAVAPSLA